LNSDGSVHGDDNQVVGRERRSQESRSIIKKNHPLMIMVNIQ